MNTPQRLVFAVAIVLLPFWLVGIANAQDREETKIRWDIIEITTSGGITIHVGGEARAQAADNSVMTLTGSGTFVPGEPDEVTGGGTWKIVDSTGHVLGMGRYRVRRLIRFDPAPGTLPATFTDTIGKNEDARAGLVFLAIRYSDGRRGILVVSCELPAGTPRAVLEGVTASKQFVDFFNFLSGDTVLHALPEGEDQ